MADATLVELNVGGKCFTTQLSTLTKYADSVLAKMFQDDYSKLTRDGNGRIFIDRDGDTFRYILEYLRDGRLQLSSTDKDRVRNEATHFGISELARMLEAPSRKLNVSQTSVAERQKTCITLGYRGTFAFGKDGLIDVKFRKLSRLLVAGKLSVCREVFQDTLNESRDPDNGDAESRYSSRLYLKHSSLEQAFDMLYENGFRLVTSCGTGTSAVTAESLKPGVDPEESKWQHYNEFVFVRD